jgi:hypothetical protein
VSADAASSVADGTRDAALEAARLSADAKDVAAYKAGDAPLSVFLNCSKFNYRSGLTNQSRGLEWRRAIADDVSQQLLKLVRFHHICKQSVCFNVPAVENKYRIQVQLHDCQACFFCRAANHPKFHHYICHRKDAFLQGQG